MSFISICIMVSKLNHWTTTKRVLTYVKGTLDFHIKCRINKYPRLCGYIDSNWVGFVDDRKSTFGNVLNLHIGAIPLTNKKKHVVSISLIEIEYRGVLKGVCEEFWLRRMLSNMNMQNTEPTPLFSGDQGVLKLAKNLVFYNHTKNVEIHFHFIG
jgi:hypothetical protein